MEAVTGSSELRTMKVWTYLRALLLSLKLILVLLMLAVLAMHFPNCLDGQEPPEDLHT